MVYEEKIFQAQGDSDETDPTEDTGDETEEDTDKDEEKPASEGDGGEGDVEGGADTPVEPDDDAEL